MIRRVFQLSLVVTLGSGCIPETTFEEERVGTAQEEITHTFSTHEVFDPGLGGSANLQRGADPFVRVASNGDIYVAATSFPIDPLFSDGAVLWRSTDNGSSWAYLGTAGFIDHLGLEPAMTMDSSGRLWIAEFHPAVEVAPIFRYDTPSAIVDRSTDYDARAFGTPPGERPWVSSYGNRIHVQYGEATVVPAVRISTNGSANPPVFGAPIPLATNLSLLAEMAGGTNTSTTIMGIAQGPLSVNQSNGHMCGPLLPLNGATGAGAGYMPAHSLWTACSTNGGTTWTNTLVYKNTNTSIGLMNLWPESAVDSSGNFYFLVAANMDASGNITTGVNIFLFTSTNGGTTWSAPKKVNPDGGTNIFPKAVAGCNGGIDVVWYGTSTAGQPNMLPSSAEWHVYMAQSKNATATSPTWNTTDVTGTVVHYGVVNHKGLFNSPSVDYRIFTIPAITLDEDAKAHIIWADTSDPWSLNPNANPDVQYMGNPAFGRLYHSIQTSGPELDTCP
jgi:hypothetical protein